MADDEIIRKRLLLDGDGSGDEKRLVTFMKSFLKWCNNPNEDDASNSAFFERLLAMLATCQSTIAKNYLVYQMNKRELENYQVLNEDLTDRIKRAQEDICNLKEELQEAKRTRRHQQEYDALGKAIQQHPNKEETTKILTALESHSAVEKELDQEKTGSPRMKHSSKKWKEKLR
ncbi:THO complex subunit 7-like protein [Trichoplax sp. H2]|nr:THO complex subunit 7-like protein [Trichoplax sp. H2]|eukprot:RDD43812.1 THO complex subunit 7-like protein [Trichoplax sp. H2]